MVPPSFESRDAFTVAGLHYHGANANDEIPQLWESYGTRMDEFSDLAVSDETFGVCYEQDYENGTFDYVAGVEVDSNTDVPSDLETVELPEQEYAVFTTSLNTLDERIDEIYEEWLPASEYRRAQGPEFERYSEVFDPDDPDSVFAYFVPVESGE